MKDKRGAAVMFGLLMLLFKKKTKPVVETRTVTVPNTNLPASDGTADIGAQVQDAQDQPVERKKLTIGQKIMFKKGKATILPESLPILDEVAAALHDHPNVILEVEGHTSAEGSEAFNMKLSESRADAVCAYLSSHDINPDRLIAKGYGETRSIASNDTEAGREKNRRVEFFVSTE